MNNIIRASLCVLILVHCQALAQQDQDDSSQVLDDAGGIAWMLATGHELTDSEEGAYAGALTAPTAIPLAYGVVYNDGSKQSGSTNWTSAYNATSHRYEITIGGENYHYSSYATIVTPAGDVRYCRTDSVSGKLLVYCVDKIGSPAPSRFSFAVYKP